MASYNKVLLIGNLTRDPEMRYTENKAAVVRFGIAINEKYKEKETGVERENVCFVDVEAWNRQAEIANEYLSKGRPVFIEGSLKFDSWEDNEGKKRSKLSVRAFRIQFLGSRDDSQGDQSYSAPTSSSPTDGIPF